MKKPKGKSPALRRSTDETGSNDSSQRRQRIAEAAYYKAERRGFAPGEEDRDWLDAERAIDGKPPAT
jgi:hypothetical protein